MRVERLEWGQGSLAGLNNLNIIMGRNGAGKSRFMRSIDGYLSQQPNEFHAQYISPERAGTFQRDGNIITNMGADPNWMRNSRLVNQAYNFKSASAVLLRELETLYLRKLASSQDIRSDFSRNFETDRLKKINSLLTNVYLEVGPKDFEFKTIDGVRVSPNDISSGESEAVSLATEIIYFFDTIDKKKFNVLLVDEPDVHLHPDLQARLANLIIVMLNEYSDIKDNIAVCVTTHSAPFVCAVSDSPYTSLGTKSFGNEHVTLERASDQLKKIGPFFGHPLSLTLNNDAPLILEGEDDERVWQQAARSSKGKIKLFPVLASSVDQQGKLENFSVGLLKTIYDKPLAFSLRDGDGVVGEKLEPNGPLLRYRLNCYAIENLLLTDQCLQVMNTDWPNFRALADKWLRANEEAAKANKTEQARFELVASLIQSEDRLQHAKIKDIRNTVCVIAGCKKPWEVVVGQAIGAITPDDIAEITMIVDFIGQEAVSALLFRNV